MEIRKDAPIELPHILVLIDDPERTVIEAVGKKVMAREGSLLYDVPFSVHDHETKMKGYAVHEKEEIDLVVKALTRLSSPELQKEKYQLEETPTPVLFCMGDGNHSLATAKGHWEKIKATIDKDNKELLETHPARYALVEIINLYDDSIPVFHPIHRVIMKIDFKDFFEFIKWLHKDAVIEHFEWNNENEKKIEDARKTVKEGEQFFPIYFDGDKCGYLLIRKPTKVLEVATLQNLLDNYCACREIDLDRQEYIHGDEEIKNQAKHKGYCSFMLQQLDKKKLFRSVLLTGVCPRKTFSIGHSYDKRAYLECRKIIK